MALKASDTEKKIEDHTMDKFGRIALTITFSPGELDAEVNQNTTNAELINLLCMAARGKSQESFVEDVAIWHCLAGYKETTDGIVNEKDVETLDKQLVHTMALQRAQTLLASPQLLQAMLLTFSQLIPQLGIMDTPPESHKDSNGGDSDLVQ